MVLATTIIVPCYNEAERLDVQAFRRFAEQSEGLHFLMVDDGSTDDTLGVLESLATTDGFSLLACSRNSGKAEAVRAGFQEVLARNDAQAIGFWDADLATPLVEIDRFRRRMALDEAIDIVIGARVKLLGRRIERQRMRHYMGRATATIVSNLLDLPVYDTQCGAKIFRVTPLLPQLFDAPFSTRWAFDVEILARWIGGHRELPRRALEERILEIPLDVWTDVAGSKIQARDFLATPLDLARIVLRYRSELTR